jgi:hypothetical protein
VYRDRVDQIVNYFHEQHPDELKNARGEFFSATGEIYDDDPFFEDRTANYLEWFLFDRPLADGRLPITVYFERFADGLRGDDLDTLRAMTQPVHSLFQVKRLLPKNNIVVLTDLADNSRYDVTERRSMVGLEKGDIFEARLITRGDKTVFLYAFVHHPRAAKRFLARRMKQLRKSGIDELQPFFLALQKMWMQSNRYQHVDPARIYSDDRLRELWPDVG